MRQRLAVTISAFLLATASVLGIEVVATLKRVDAERGVVVVFAKGQDRTLKADKNLRVLDAKGNHLSEGLKSPELKEGTRITITVERTNDEIWLKQLRVGDAVGGGEGPKLQGKPTVGLKPLTEMTAEDRYKGEEGGLYGGGQNDPPAGHWESAKKETARITPLDAQGQPSREGQIGLISISMSNATQEFSMFKRLADADAEKSPRVTIVDCAQGGQAMAQWAPAEGRPWQELERRLKAAGLTAHQVQVVWIKLANVGPRGDLAEHGKKLRNDTLAVLHNARRRFPNLRVAYLSSRIYGGYSTGPTNPEPYAYEGAFVVRWLIQEQIRGEAELNFSSERGAVKAPLLLWGPYLWADGTTPRRSDGLTWERADLAADGLHPSESGRQKVARLLLNFFKTDPLAKTWFLKP